MSTTISNKIDLVVSFDTTGSMYPVLAQVRTEVEKFVKQMFNEFTDLRLGIIAHGDYCDAGNPYTIISKDFTRDEEGLCKFIRETQKTYGGDADECYELVLNTAHKQLTWRDDADKIMIMIGDASPHGVFYRDNKEHLDWEEEAKTLASKGIKVFAVHALSYYRSSSKEFYKTVAKITDGTYLTLDQFNEVVDLIKATCYQQGGEEKLNEFITIIRDNGKMTNSMDRNFRRLRGETVEEDTYYRRTYDTPKRVSHKRATSVSADVTIKEMGKLVPVMPGRFQVMTVDANCDIKGFVTKNGIEFKKGRGFYELSKAETVQQYKEVIMQDKETGEMFTGTQVREELGLQPQSEKGGVNERLHKDAAKKFRVFVQSTSVNRKLIAGTTFLYEISDIEDTGTVVEAKAVETPVVETKLPEKVITGEKFDVDLAVKLIEKSNEAVKTDSMIIAATKKTKKKSASIKKLAEKIDIKAEIDEVTTDEGTTVKVEKPSDKKAKTHKTYVKPEMKVITDKEEVTAKLAEDTTFSDVGKSEYFAEVTVEKSKTKVAKVKDAKKPEKVKVDKRLVAKTTTTNNIKNQSEKLVDALDRYAKSENKKNTIYLTNNLKKMIEYAEKMLEVVENK